MKGEAIKGHLDLLLLATVSTAPAHGYAIIDALRRRSGGAFDLPEDTVYPALHRLEASGLLKSHWETAGGRRRRVYEITYRGRGAMEQQKGDWSIFCQAVTGVVGT